jgi:hypothetical protein
LLEIDQDAVTRLKKTMLRPNPRDGTVYAEIISPLRAVLGLAHKRGWCDLPHFVIPKLTEGRTLYLFPNEAERLIPAAAPHLKPLLIFLLGTGARLSEAICARCTRAAMRASSFSVAANSSARLRARSSASSGFLHTTRRSPG